MGSSQEIMDQLFMICVDGCMSTKMFYSSNLDVLDAVVLPRSLMAFANECWKNVLMMRTFR